MLTLSSSRLRLYALWLWLYINGSFRQDRIAVRMVEDAEESGRIKVPVHTMVLSLNSNGSQVCRDASVMSGDFAC